MTERRNEQNTGTSNMGKTTGGQGSMGGSQGSMGGSQGSMGGGQNNINQLLQNVNFPATKQDLLNRVGNQQVNVNGRNVQAREVINRIPQDRFQDRNEFERAIKNVPEFQGGSSGGTSGYGGTRTGGGRQ